MPFSDDDGSRALGRLTELRIFLKEARESDDAERIHTALIEVVEALIAQAEIQARATGELQSRIGKEQGRDTVIGGGKHSS